MKKKLISFLAPYFYPQCIFAKEILVHIKCNETRLLIDCPCGNGETSYNLAKKQNIQVIAFDINKLSIVNAAANLKKTNLSYQRNDIFYVLNETIPFNYFALVNSLFNATKKYEIEYDFNKFIISNNVIK